MRQPAHSTHRSARRRSLQQQVPVRKRQVTGRFTRRQVITGALAGVAATAVAGITLPMVACKHDAQEPVSTTASEAPVLIEEGAYLNLLDFDARDPDAALKHTYRLPLGTVLHISSDKYGAALVRSQDVQSLSHLAVFDIESGKLHTVLKKAHEGQGFSLYDMRCSDELIVWSEINYDTNSWALFAAPLTTGELTTGIVRLDSGDATLIPPDFCVWKNRAFWQIMPNPNGDKKTLHSKAYQWELGQETGKELWDSPGHFATAPLMSGGSLVITPRMPSESGVYYGITALAPDTGATVDQMVMPKSVRPMSAVYFGDTNKFGVVVEATYQSGGLLGHMGSYIGGHNDRFMACSKEPYAPIVSIGKRIAIKNRGSYLVFDTTDNTYFRLPLANNSLEWGDFSAAVGPVSRLIVYATVKDPKTGLPHEVVVRYFSFPQDKERQEAEQAGQQKPVTIGGDAPEQEPQQVGVGVVTGGNIPNQAQEDSAYNLSIDSLSQPASR